MNNVLSLSEAAKAAPSFDGKTLHVSSIWRWCRQGIKRGGARVSLRYVRVGRRIGIPREALSEFFVALAQADRAAGPIPPPQECQPVTPKGRTPAQRAAAIERARKELQEA